MAKHPGGRPLKFKSVEELEKKIQEYFDKCRDEDDIPTIAELAVYLDTSRQTLINYEEKEQFFDTIKKAKDMVLAIQEKAALKGGLNPTVWIFSAKNNFGYTDKVEVESQNTNHNINEDISNLTPEERQKRIQELLQKRGKNA